MLQEEVEQDDEKPSRYPEAESFALEAMNEAIKSKEQPMAREVVYKILRMFRFMDRDDVEEMERLYCELSCDVSLLRHQRTLGVGGDCDETLSDAGCDSAEEEPSEHRVKRQRIESV